MKLVQTILGPILAIIDKAVPDTAEASRLKAEIEKAVIENEAQMLEAAATIAQADAKSEGWMTRNARPAVVFNMLLFLNVFVGTCLVNPELAQQMADAMASVPNMVWALIAGGIGVYPVIRGVEKMRGVAGK